MKDIHGLAILDYYKRKQNSPLLLHNSYDEPEEMPVEVFFREEIDLTTLEHLALIECKGKVLDVGAGAGAMSLILESRGFDVIALENSPGCVEVMKMSGVSNVVYSDFMDHKEKYDTLLLLMNGIGLAGSLSNVPKFLEKCVKLLNEGGQILLDSSDISYLYEDESEQPKGYLGNIRYKYEYNGNIGQWFDWVYVRQQELIDTCSSMGINCEILMTDENDQYLACLTTQ